MGRVGTTAPLLVNLRLGPAPAQQRSVGLRRGLKPLGEVPGSFDRKRPGASRSPKTRSGTIAPSKTAESTLDPRGAAVARLNLPTVNAKTDKPLESHRRAIRAQQFSPTEGLVELVLAKGARRRSGDQVAGRRASQYSSKRPLK